MVERGNPTSYDRIPYPGKSYPQSHPGRLEALGTLFGMKPPDSIRCRVLELGCGQGANLIPMASSCPQSEFLGIDLSVRQVARGQEVIETLGLGNIALLHLDIMDFGEDHGVFDYIIAHGVYSWVPEQTQRRIIKICKEHLSENGIAYVSYNTYPGWRMRGMLRDMMLYHSRKFADPQTQIDQARALINWLADSVKREDNPYGVLLGNELAEMRYWEDTYFRHDSLEEVNEPVYFHEFIEQASSCGLQYLGEAEFSTMVAGNYSSGIHETLRKLGRNIIEMEQYMDFLRNRLFRQTLLCHDDITLTRALTPKIVSNMFMSASIKPESPAPDLTSNSTVRFRGPGDIALSSECPLSKTAIMCLSEMWPRGVPFDELLHSAHVRLGGGTVQIHDPGRIERDRETLGSTILTLYARGLCDLHIHPSRFVLECSERPEADAFARFQASQEGPVTNRRHECVNLDTFGLKVLALLDGEHDRDDLLEILTDLVAEDVLVIRENGNQVNEEQRIREIMVSQLDMKLNQMARAALLIG